MSSQVIELLFFAGIAFFLVSKLLSVLGTTNEGDAKTPHSGSFFGEPAGMKDVTQPLPAIDIAIKEDLKDFIVQDNANTVLDGMRALCDKMPSFDLQKFIAGSKIAFDMILSASENKDDKALESLVDKRFLESFLEQAKRYGSYNKSEALDARASEIYMFGNTAFVKVAFAGTNVTSKMKGLKEEWVFTKNAAQRGPEWYLSNIESL